MAGILSIQINSLMGDKARNLDKITTVLENFSDKKLDMVVIPEFFSTNIDYEKAPEDKNGGKTIEYICELAKEFNTNIVSGTVVRKIEDKYFNTCFAIDRNGQILAEYDKIHLFNYMGGNEGSFTSAGNKIVTVNFDFAKIGLAICFDVRYPLHFNKLIKENVDIITLPTAWLIPKEIYKDTEALKTAKDMWLGMNKTRAYDNMVYYVVSNQTGLAGNNFYGIGNSMIISPTAQIISSIDEDEGAAYADIDIELVKYLRQIYPISRID